MTVSVKMLNDSIKKISETNTLLDMLLEFERTLDSMDLYAFANWNEGEVLTGPDLGRHYMTVSLIYPKDKMPDPEGAKRLLAKECLVKFRKDKLLSPRKVKNFDDLVVEQRPDGSIKYKAKADSQPVWVVEIKMPRRYVDEFDTDVVEIDKDNFVDMEDAGTDAQLDAQGTAGAELTAPGAI